MASAIASRSAPPARSTTDAHGHRHAPRGPPVRARGTRRWTPSMSKSSSPTWSPPPSCLHSAHPIPGPCRAAGGLVKAEAWAARPRFDAPPLHPVRTAQQAYQPAPASIRRRRACPGAPVAQGPADGGVGPEAQRHWAAADAPRRSHHRFPIALCVRGPWRTLGHMVVDRDESRCSRKPSACELLARSTIGTSGGVHRGGAGGVPGQLRRARRGDRLPDRRGHEARRRSAQRGGGLRGRRGRRAAATTRGGACSWWGSPTSSGPRP